MMRVLVVGASGGIGTRLVPLLIAGGHEVIGTSRSPDSAERVRRLGATSITLDLLHRRAVRNAVLMVKPHAIVQQATALSGLRDFRHFERSFAQTNRLRTKGTDALLAAGREVGVRRFVAQSYASARYAREGAWIKTEEDALDPTPVSPMRETDAAIRHLESAVTSGGGVALRYGAFYGSPGDVMVDAVRRRKFPPCIYNVVDDEPAPAREWLPVLADVLGAKPPRRVPRWLARRIAGKGVDTVHTETRGASNAKAKRELGWTLRHPSWREGFVSTYASTPAERRPSSPAETLTLAS